MTAKNFHKEYSKTTRLYQGVLVCTFDEMIDFAEAYHADKKKKPIPAHTFYVKEAANSIGKKYLSQYNEFIKLLFGGDIPSEGILKLKSQLTYTQFEKVLLKASSRGERLSDLISAMANTDRYTKGRKSVYLILNSWLSKERMR